LGREFRETAVERQARILFIISSFLMRRGIFLINSHLPDQGEQIVRYYDFYSNVSQGLRQKENQDTLIPLSSMKKLYEPPHF